MSASPLPTPGLAQEIRATGRLAFPLIAGHVSTGLVGFVDNIVAGHHDTSTLAAVTIGTSLLWIPMMIPLGTLIALAAMVSHHDGAGRRELIAPLFRQAIWLTIGLAVWMFAFLSLVPYALAPMGIAADIIPGATGFLLSIRWGMPALAIYLCMRNLSEGMHWTLPTMLMGFGGLLLLAPLGYAFTFGIGFLPELGASGLGIASAIMMWIQAIVFFIYLSRSKRFAPLGLFARFERPDWKQIYSLLRTGLPIGITALMESGLYTATALLAAHLGSTQAAAHQVAMSLVLICYMVPMGLSEATTVRVGHALGRNDTNGVRSAVRASYVLVLCTQLFSASVLLLLHNTVAGIYTSDLAVAGIASSLIIIAAIFQIPDGLQVVSAGALRGLKDTTIPMLLAAMSFWVIGIPISVGLGLGLGYGPHGIWVGLAIGLSTAALLMVLRLRHSTARLINKSKSL